MLISLHRLGIRRHETNDGHAKRRRRFRILDPIQIRPQNRYPSHPRFQKAQKRPYVLFGKTTKIPKTGQIEWKFSHWTTLKTSRYLNIKTRKSTKIVYEWYGSFRVFEKTNRRTNYWWKGLINFIWIWNWNCWKFSQILCWWLEIQRS